MTENRQGIGIFGAISATVGLIIGSAVFVLLPEITGIAGGSVWLVYLLSGIPTFIAVFYLLQIGGTIPVSGTHYVAITKWINPLFGFVTMFAVVLGLLCVAPLVSLGFGEYMQSFFPTVNPKLLAISLIAFFCMINYFGVKFFNAVQISMFILLLSAIMIFVFAGVPAGTSANRTPLMPNGTGGFFIATAIAANSWLGITGITEIAGVVRNPKRTVPIALVVSVALVALLYCGMAFTFSGLMNHERAAEIGSSAILTAANSFLPVPVVIFIAIGAMMAMSTSINAFIQLIINMLHPMCHNRILPAGFMKPNRFNAPSRMIIFFFIAPTLLILIFGSKLSSYAIMSVVGVMFMQFMGAVAVIRMPKRSPELYKNNVFHFQAVTRWIIFILCTLAFWSMIAFSFFADWKASTAFFIICLLSLVYWFGRSSFLNKRGENLKKVITENNEAILNQSLT